MPRVCQCGARLRVDGSCPTVGCVAFRPSRRGANLVSKAVLRLRGKCAVATVRFRAAKDHNRPAEPGGTSQAASLQHAMVQKGLRAAELEEILVETYDLVGYFRIMATAIHWLGRCAGALDGMPADLATVALIATAANFEGLTPGSRSVSGNLLLELSQYSRHPRKKIISCMAVFCNAYRGTEGRRV
jgi:hypothetical protein